MRFPLKALAGGELEQAARCFDELGYFMIEGVEGDITRHFKPLVADRMQVSVEELDRLLDPNSPPMILPVEIRQRMSRIDSTGELARTLLGSLEPVFIRLLGPFVHVSSTFHGQFKGGEVKPVDHGGYDPRAQYLEVQGQYLIHQDFAGAAIPTSPAGVTLWTPLNSCPDWNLRLYPGSHRAGLLCNEWMKLDDPRLASFGEPIDIHAEVGTAVIFNSLLLHSSSNPGPRRRVSCDIRFFPLCPFLPSLPHVLGDRALEDHRAGLARADGDTLRAPHLEAAAFMGTATGLTPCEPTSILNWANYVQLLVRGDADAAFEHLRRFVNEERGIDTVEAYRKFHDRPRHAAPLEHLLAELTRRYPGAAETRALAEQVGRLQPAAS
jgi:hypothetical protein